MFNAICITWIWRLNKLGIMLLLLSLFLSASGQQLNFDFYSKGNGLVNNEVHSITQGSNRFMYFGTPSGFSVYDGGAFTNYDPGNGFRQNFISSIRETANEGMFVLTGSNVFYHFSNQTLTADSFPGKIIVKNIYTTPAGLQIACSNTGLYVFNKGMLTRLPVNSGKTYEGINCILQWHDSLLIVGGSYEPIEIYNLHTWKLLASSAKNVYVRNMCTDKMGNVWIATIGAGICMLKSGVVYKKNFAFEKLPDLFAPFLSSEFRAIVLDQMGNLWMGSINRGLLKYNPDTHVFFHISMEQGLVSNTIFSLYCDKEDNLWIGTNRGLQKLVQKNVFSYTSKQGLPADLVLDIMPLPGHRIITCGYSGVGLIRGFAAEVQSWQPPLADEYLSKFSVYANHCFGLSLKKLIELNFNGTGIIAGKMFSLPEHFRTLINMQNKGLLLGGDSSILFFRNGKISLVVKDSVHYISCMALTDSGILWTGNLRNEVVGYSLHEKNKSIRATPIYHYVGVQENPDDYLQSMVCDKSNRIVCGRFLSGITVLKNENGLKQVLTVNINDGLSSNNVISLAWYNDSTLLAGTGRGLDKVVFYSKKDSFSVSNLNDYYNFSNSVYSIRKTDDGGILLGTESGITSLPGIDIDKELHLSPPVIISSVMLLSNPDSLLNFKKTIELPYNNNGLIIHFASPSFTFDKGKRFVYRLNGSSRIGWSRPVTSDNVVFSNLLPGQYQFLVKSLNLAGEFSVGEAALDILIRPPFWQRWWFYMIWILILAAIIWMVIRRKIENIRNTSAVKGRIAEAEMMALRSQMNPHFIFNCMNIIDSLITSNRKAEALDFLQKFSKLIRLVLENSIHPLVPLQQDLQALELYIELEVVRNNHRFTYSIDVDEDLLEEGYKIPPLLLQPYIENAIIHGLRHKENAGGKLVINIKREFHKVVIHIEDNGIGRINSVLMNKENSGPAKHLGMEVTGRRIDLLQIMTGHQVAFHIQDMQDTGDRGTRVEIILPEYFEFEQDTLN